MAGSTIQPMALTVGERPIRPLTADEVMRMVATGILDEDERLELLHGVLTAVGPHSDTHAGLVQRLTRWLSPLVVAGAHDLRVRMPLAVPDETSLPEPDVAIVERRDSLAGHPGTAFLVVEIAVSSLRTDMTVKPPLYAAAGVPEYWVVDAEHRRLELFADPRGGDYTRRETREPSGTLTPLVLDVEPLDLAAFFAGV